LSRRKKVGLVEDEDHTAVTLGLLSGEKCLGLGHDLGLVEAGAGAQRGDDGDVEAAGAECRVTDVEDVVADGVERGDGGADGDGLADADVAGDDANGGFADAVGNARNGLEVGVAEEEVGGMSPPMLTQSRRPHVGDPRLRFRQA